MLSTLILFGICGMALLGAFGLAGSYSQIIAGGLTTQTTTFAAGMALAILTTPFLKLTTLHTFEHEAIHAVANFCCGGKLLSFFIRYDGSGQVYLTKINLFVSLAPYFIPLFASIAFLLSLALIPVTKDISIVAAGFLYLNFLRYTCLSLTVNQPDLTVNEKYVPVPVKYGIVALGNLFVLVLWISFLQNVSFIALIKGGLELAIQFISQII